MEYIDLVALMGALISALFALSGLILGFRGREVERRRQLEFEELRLRETELKYASSIRADSRHALIDLVRSSISALDEIDQKDVADASPSLRASLHRLRMIQYQQLDTLIGALDADRGESNLGRLRGILEDRRMEMDAFRQPATESDVS
jgi:hypothetical protein